MEITVVRHAAPRRPTPCKEILDRDHLGATRRTTPCPRDTV